MRQDRARLWAAWLLGLLVLTPVMTLFDLRPNNVPSEPPVSRPVIEPTRLLDVGYWAEFDRWISDSAATRGVGLLARAKLDYELFGDSTSELVAVGSGGWLFSRPRAEYPCELIDSIVAPPIPKGNEAEIVYMVPLPKVHWLVDRLEPHDRPLPCSQRARQDLVDRLAGDPSALDVNALMDDPEQMFFKGDTGWSPHGQLGVAEALIERLVPGLWEAESVSPARVPERRDLFRLLGYADHRTTDGYAIDRDVTFRLRDRRGGTELLSWQRSFVDGGPVVPGTTYIFGDSQLARVIPLIEQYFERLVFIGWIRTELTTIDFASLPPPDRIIIEAAEFSAAQRLSEPILEEAFALLRDRTPPLPPTDVTAVATRPDTVELIWSPAVEDRELNSYLVARDGREIELLDPDVTSYTDTGATPDTTHVYTVVATDAAGNTATTDPVSVTTPAPDTTPPTEPGNITVTATSRNSVEITWEPSTDEYGILNYVVARDGQRLEVYDPGQTSYRHTDTDLEAGSLHAYTVTATDTQGNVTISEAVVVATPSS